MKPMRYGFRAEDHDVRWQLVVDSTPQCVGWQVGMDIQMGDLCQRVDAGVGSTRSVQFEVVDAGRCQNRAFELPLNRARVLLNLPAAVPRPGVFKGQFQSHSAPGIIPALVAAVYWSVSMPSPTAEFKPPLLSSVKRRLPVGAEPRPEGGVHFRVWAPAPHSISLVTEQDGQRHDCALERDTSGYCETFVGDAGDGTRYWYRVDGELLPDPASRWQPEAPFGPSMVVDAGRFARSSAPSSSGVSMRNHGLYEVHGGSFTREGTWRGAVEKLPLVARTGVTVVEVMPVAEFPDRFGWGYDVVFPYAPTRLYGTPDDFRAFVDAAHQQGLFVILDVVYNHLGPDGCVFGRFAADYFSRQTNEWGQGLNFDGPNSDPVREYFSSNAAYWIDEYRLDGLRLDATQSMHDT